MKKITQEELNEILKNHKLWLESDGKEGEKANLSYLDLSYANLSYWDLSYANLSCTNLFCAMLSYTTLSHAILSYANLSYATLYCTDLSYTDLFHTILYDTDLYAARNIPYIPLACPSDGGFVGWKKCRDDKIVKLYIPESAKRLSATTNKCRCDKAVVMDIFDKNGNPCDVAFSEYDSNFIYEKGKTIIPNKFSENRWNECSNGIHFFIDREEAERY